MNRILHRAIHYFLVCYTSIFSGITRAYAPKKWELFVRNKVLNKKSSGVNDIVKSFGTVSLSVQWGGLNPVFYMFTNTKSQRGFVKGIETNAPGAFILKGYSGENQYFGATQPGLLFQPVMYKYVIPALY